MDEYQTLLKWNIDGDKDAFYQVSLYKYPDWYEGAKKLSTIKVVGLGHEIDMRGLAPNEVESLISAIEQIQFQYSFSNEICRRLPVDDYRLEIKSENFKLDFSWDSNGILGNEVLYKSLMGVIDSLCEIREVFLFEFGMQAKE
jgi:hypothetical protein